MTWRESISGSIRRGVEDVDDFVDVAWRRFVKRMGFGEARHIAAYTGYSNGNRLWVRGRLLGNKPYGGPKEDDNWWDNLVATYSRWETDEVPGAAIELEYAGLTQQVVTDAEGYYAAEFAVSDSAPLTATVYARHAVQGSILSAAHSISLPPRGARFLLITDMDDTVIHTGITNLLVSAQLTFLNNATTRKPLVGVGSLYRSLVGPEGEQRQNPVFYVSNSPWNMFDLLRDFLDLNDLPSGPLLLRDVGIGAHTKDHKLESIRRLLLQFPDLPVVLIGDSGQHDAAIYARITREHPGRVQAIYIRDVDPGDDGEYDVAVDRVIEEMKSESTPFLRVQDSHEIAQHAATAGLLSETKVAAVHKGVTLDRKRETLGLSDLG